MEEKIKRDSKENNLKHHEKKRERKNIEERIAMFPK